MAFAWFMAYWIKFVGTYVLTFPIRLISYLYSGIRYNRPLSEWRLFVRAWERITHTLCIGIASGATKEELKEFLDEVDKIWYES